MVWVWCCYVATAVQALLGGVSAGTGWVALMGGARQLVIVAIGCYANADFWRIITFSGSYKRIFLSRAPTWG